MSTTRMPFGKHRGQPLHAIPLNYLIWMLRECAGLSSWLRDAVAAEVDRRIESDWPDDALDGPTLDLASIARAWHREMVLRFHPDRGGSNEAMAAINHAADRLRELFAQIEAR